MDETSFHERADAVLEALEEALEEAASEHDIEADLHHGILTLSIPEIGEYVINKHSPTTQIWVSSPISGALHFAYDDIEDQWKCTQSDQRLHELLTEELAEHAQLHMTLDEAL